MLLGEYLFESIFSYKADTAKLEHQSRWCSSFVMLYFANRGYI